ncbi:B12-binding domain-containing radical SAM protein [Patescibacteria group bacterium]|nr:B12-binding domain-containing radical SAM protein [Patescibacteria group bacterium]MBU4511769.1 B12-binding domain-containing radical SAM protein [Patescibacteria group bacterium]
MKALLINPYIPLEAIYGKEARELGAVLPALGIFYIASFLKDKHEIETLDANALKMKPNKILENISKKNYDCIGLSSTTLAYPYAVEIAKIIKEKFPHLILVIGGAHAQGAPDKILKDNPNLFNFVCYGEAEHAFSLLAQYIENKIGKQELKGWKYLENDQIITAPPAPIPENLDEFGHPAEVLPKKLVPLYREKILAYKKLPIFSVMASRGCPFQCTFCSTPNKFANLYRHRVRYHSIDWIITELKLLQNMGVKEIIFVDDTFNLNKKRVIKFCEEKIKNNIDIIWSCNFEANIADVEMMEKMKEAGCWAIMVGGESGSDKILQFIKKGVTKKQLELVGKLADDAGIVSRVSFILGFPSDTKETIEETINFVKKSNFHFPYFQLYIPLPGTQMFEQLNQYGKIIKKDPKKRSASNVNYLPQGLTEEYLAKAYKQAHKKAYLNWKMIKNHFQFIRSANDIRRYWKGLKALINF